MPLKSTYTSPWLLIFMSAAFATGSARHEDDKRPCDLIELAKIARNAPANPSEVVSYLQHSANLIFTKEAGHSKSGSIYRSEAFELKDGVNISSVVVDIDPQARSGNGSVNITLTDTPCIDAKQAAKKLGLQHLASNPLPTPQSSGRLSEPVFSTGAYTDSGSPHAIAVAYKHKYPFGQNPQCITYISVIL